MKEDKNSFFPRNKPKSWICAVSFGLVGLLCAGPLIFIGLYYGISFIYGLGAALISICIIIAFPCGIYFNINLFRQKYNNLEEKSWKEQIW